MNTEIKNPASEEIAILLAVTIDRNPEAAKRVRSILGETRLRQLFFPEKSKAHFARMARMLRRK